MGRACKTYRLRSICGAQGTKNPLPLGMGSVKEIPEETLEGLVLIKYIELSEIVEEYGYSIEIHKKV